MITSDDDLFGSPTTPSMSMHLHNGKENDVPPAERTMLCSDEDHVAAAKLKRTVDDELWLQKCCSTTTTSPAMKKRKTTPPSTTTTTYYSND